LRPVCSASQVRELERFLIEDVGLPGIALMETASRGVAWAIRRHHMASAQRGVVVVCGGGNNGGDGYGCARWLHGWGIPVSTWSLSASSSGDAGRMRAACGHAGVPEVHELGQAGLLVDAVFGTGLSRPIEGSLAEVIRAMADHRADVIAVDLPSGLQPDTGRMMGRLCPARRTVTFGALKPGLFCGRGPECTGEIEMIDIGLLTAEGRPRAEMPDGADLVGVWPRRGVAVHKKHSGHLAIVAGSAPMAGAAVLCARGALAAGAGLVTLFTSHGAASRLVGLPPEVMVSVSGDGDLMAPLALDALTRASAIVAGPGLGGGRTLRPELHAWLTELWQSDARPVLFDADALAAASIGPAVGPRVITPHEGEASRLLGRSAAEVCADRFGSARDLTSWGTAVLKGPYSLVAEAGIPLSVNSTGNPVLASAGSGDVLAGAIGALLGRAVGARDACRLAAWVHGLAADRLAEQRSQGWTAGDVADAMPDAIEELLKRGGPRLT
jgi:NAD(P)H-hydrate epimerase